MEASFNRQENHELATESGDIILFYISSLTYLLVYDLCHHLCILSWNVNG